MPTQNELLQKYSKAITSGATTAAAPVQNRTAAALAGPAKGTNQHAAATDLVARLKRLELPSKAAKADTAPTMTAKGDLIATYRHYFVRTSLRIFRP
jgi:hypothetical protein